MNRQELVLIRHGNAKKLRGETYVTAPLTELGRAQAELTGMFLQEQAIQFDGYYCSELKRAVETAEIIGAYLKQTPTKFPRIQEMEYREIPGTLAAELFARTGLMNSFFDEHIGKRMRYPMIGRVTEGLLDIYARHPGGRIGLVVHGGVVSSIMARYFPRERRRWWRDAVGNCSITRLQIQNDRAEILEFDSVSHLGKLASTAHQRNYTFSGDEGV